jgi:hypothetical protein
MFTEPLPGDALIKSVTIHKNSVHASQETHHVSATKTNQLMLFTETIAVHCENCMKHTNTLCGEIKYSKTERMGYKIVVACLLRYILLISRL